MRLVDSLGVLALVGLLSACQQERPANVALVVNSSDVEGGAPMTMHSMTIRGRMVRVARFDSDKVEGDTWTQHLAFSRRGDFLAVGYSTGHVAVWSTRSLANVFEVEGGSWLQGLTYLSDGTLVVSTGQHGVIFFDQAGAEKRRMDLGRVMLGEVLGKGWYWVADDSRVVRFVRALDGGHVRSFGKSLAHDEERQNLLRPTSVAFSPDGSQVATARWDQELMVFEVATGDLLRTYPGMLDVAWSPDGKTLASATGRLSKRETNLQVRLLDVDAGAVRLDIDAEPPACFLSGGMSVAACKDDSVVVFDAYRGRELARYKEASWKADTVACSPNGSDVAVGSKGGVVLLRLE